MLKTLWRDEHGVIISAELVLIGTILILGMIVGLVGLQTSVVAELNDLGDAIGNLDQFYQTPSITSFKFCGHVKARTAGAVWYDTADDCDCNPIITCDAAAVHGEGIGGIATYRSEADRGSPVYDHNAATGVDSVMPAIEIPREPVSTQDAGKNVEQIHGERRIDD